MSRDELRKEMRQELIEFGVDPKHIPTLIQMIEESTERVIKYERERFYKFMVCANSHELGEDLRGTLEQVFPRGDKLNF